MTKIKVGSFYVVTIMDISGRTRIHPTILTKAIKSGELEAVRIGGTNLVKVESIKKWLKDHGKPIPPDLDESTIEGIDV